MIFNPVAPHIEFYPLHGTVTSQGLGGGDYIRRRFRSLRHRSPGRHRSIGRSPVRRSPRHRSPRHRSPRRHHRISARRAQDLIHRHIAGAHLRRMSPKYLRRELRRLDKEFPRRRRY